VWVSACVVLACARPAAAQEVSLHVSSLAGDRLSPKAAVRFEPASAGADIRIDPAVTHQTIVGFGASFLEAGLVCLNALPEAEQEGVLEGLFDPVKGAGFSAMKTVIAGTDFMSAGPWYTYADTPGDVEMKTLSIARDLGPNGLVTYIKRARKHGSFVLQAPMDYPPDWMLVDVQHRQDIDPKRFDTLALYYLRYLQEYEKQGIVVDYLSLFNEPGIYTKIPYGKIRDLLRDHVGPLLAREGVRTRIQLSEAPSREDAVRSYPTVLDDPEARKYVASIAYHGYDLEHFDGIAELHRRYPNLPLWMTEICHAYEAGTPKSMPLPRYDFEDGDFWAEQIFGDLGAGASAWIYWNMILDEKGGPWLVSPVHGNPDPNAQHPVLVVDRTKKKVTYTGLYYYLAHFGRFVRPGAVRVGTTGGRKGVLALAFRAPDGRIVAQLANRRREDVSVRLGVDGKAATLPLPAISITTAIWAP
jgi:glucosylceramidase